MRLIDGILYIEFQEMVDCGVKSEYMRKAKSMGTNCWDFIDDPKDKRKVLVQYDTLREVYKEKVKARFGDPYVRVARTPILNMVIQDAAAHSFFVKHRYGSDQYLPLRVVNKYTRGASWLNMLSRVQQDRDIIRKELNIQKVPDFYVHVADLIKTEIQNGKDADYSGINELPGDFAWSYQRILNNVRTYQERGYEYLIAPEWGNKNSAKIGKTENGFDETREQEQMAVIRNIASRHNNLDAAQVKKMADIIFDTYGWTTISESRIYQIMQENKVILLPGRRGKREFHNTVAMQNKRVAPKFPTYYWTLDGWTVELLYQDEKRYDNRLVVVVVLDPMNKYPVGYAIGERETPELIKEANRNALLHLQQLFGDMYFPYQLQSDRYQLKHLTPFYQAMAHFHTPASVGNAKAKVIEPYFKHLNKKYCQPQYNWSGFNIDSKRSNQVNREMLNAIKKTMPDMAGVEKQIHGIIAYERKAKISEYMQRWEAMPVEHRQVMSRMDWLMVFGSPIGATNRLVGQGIIKTINGIEYTYDCFDASFRDHLNTDWQIIADLQDLETVLAVSENGKQRFVLERKMELPMDARSTTTEHNDYRKRIKDFNDEQEQRIIDIYAQDNTITSRLISDVPLSLEDPDEAALKLMFTTNGQQKEGIQNAKKLRERKMIENRQAEREQEDQQKAWQAMQDEYLNSQTDFSRYKV